MKYIKMMKNLGMCGASLLNTDGTDHRKSEGTAIPIPHNMLEIY